MKSLIVVLLGIFLITSCGQSQIEKKSYLGEYDSLSSGKKSLPKNLKIDNDCIDDAAYESSNFISETERLMINMSGITVSDSEVNDFGDKAYEEIRKEGKYKFIESGNMYDDLQILLAELIKKSDINSDYKYKIHLIDDTLINAFTVGGHIFITTGIISFAKSRSAVAFIIGHEIGHNENGDLEMLIKKLKLANSILEGSGDIGIAIQQIITPFYNQINEIEADRYGVNISYQSGYDPRKGVDLWKRMAKDEESENFTDSFARSHPYSIDRFNCLDLYINSNFNL